MDIRPGDKVTCGTSGLLAESSPATIAKVFEDALALISGQHQGGLAEKSNDPRIPCAVAFCDRRAVSRSGNGGVYCDGHSVPSDAPIQSSAPAPSVESGTALQRRYEAELVKHYTYTVLPAAWTVSAGPSDGTVSIGTGGALVPPSDHEDHEAARKLAESIEDEWSRYRMWYYGGYVPWTSSAGAKPKPDTRCPRVDADTGIRCMHEAGAPHAHETPAGKPIFEQHAGPKFGEYRVTGFGVTLDLPIPPGPVEKLLIRAEAVLHANPAKQHNWPKNDLPSRPFTPNEVAARLRGAGSHLAALRTETLDRPFYKGKRVRR